MIVLSETPLFVDWGNGCQELDESDASHFLHKKD